MIFAFSAACASGADYRSVSIDQNRQLHIVDASGRKILAPKLRGQMSFKNPSISPDHATVGWLVEYPDPFSGSSPLGLALVVYRNGRILHEFQLDLQVFHEWQFQDGGKQIAYSTGSTHGGSTWCVLRDVTSGRQLSTWDVADEGVPPAWSQPLSMNFRSHASPPPFLY